MLMADGRWRTRAATGPVAALPQSVHFHRQRHARNSNLEFVSSRSSTGHVVAFVFFIFARRGTGGTPVHGARTHVTTCVVALTIRIRYHRIRVLLAARLPRLIRDPVLSSTCLASIPLTQIMSVVLSARNTRRALTRVAPPRLQPSPQQETYADAGLFGQLPSPSRSLDAMIVSARARPA